MKPFWDARYAEDELAYGSEPNDWLAEVADLLPTEGTALEVAAGQGRNAVFLARRGLEVTAVDQSGVGLVRASELADARGVRLATVAEDLNLYSIGSERWDVIVEVFAHLPSAERADLHRRVVRGLKPGGVYVTESYTPDQLARGTGGPPVADRLVTLQQLVAELEGLEVLAAEETVRSVVEGAYHKGEASVVRLVARKPAAAA